MIREQIERLSKSTVIYGVGQVLNRFIGFLLLPLFTAYLTPADYGLLAILGLISFVSTSVFSLGIGGAAGVCYYDGNSREQKEQTIWTSVFMLMGSTLLLCLCAALFSRQISWLAFQRTDHNVLVIMTLLSAGATILAMPLMLYLQFEEKAKLFITLTMISTLFSIGLSCFLVILLKRGVLGMVESTLIASMVNLCLFTSVVISQLRIRVSGQRFRELLKFGMPLVPAFAMLFILQHANKYILQWFSGIEAVGVYNIGFNIGLAMSLLVSALQSAWLPYFMSFTERRDEARILFGRILTYYVFGFGAISLLFFIYAKPIIMIMTQPAFYEAYKVVGLSAGACFISGVFYILLPGIYFAKDVRYVTVIQTISAGIAVVLNFVLIPMYGLFGAAMALIFGFVTMVICMQLWNYSQKNQYIKIAYEWKRIMQFSIIYTLYATVMLWERHLSLFGELMMSLAATCLLPLTIYVLLKSNEKMYLRLFCKRLISGNEKFLRGF